MQKIKAPNETRYKAPLDCGRLTPPMAQTLDLSRHEIDNEFAVRNAPPAPLYEDAVMHEHAAISDSGALIIRSGKKTGRSPLDKRIVDHTDSSRDVWWGPVNIKLDEQVFVINRQRAIDYLNTREQAENCLQPL